MERLPIEVELPVVNSLTSYLPDLHRLSFVNRYFHGIAGHVMKKKLSEMLQVLHPATMEPLLKKMEARAIAKEPHAPL